MWSPDTGRRRRRSALGSGYILSSSGPLSPVFPSGFRSFSSPSLGNCFLSSVYLAGPKWLLLGKAPSLPPLFAFACLFTLDCSPSSLPGYILSAPSRVQPFPGSCPPAPKAGISVPLWASRFASAVHSILGLSASVLQLLNLLCFSPTAHELLEGRTILCAHKHCTEHGNSCEWHTLGLCIAPLTRSLIYRGWAKVGLQLLVWKNTCMLWLVQ